MHLTFKDSIYATVAYADIFGFPLTPAELFLWSIGNRKNKGILQTNISIIRFKNERYLYLSSKNLAADRLKKEAWSKEKWRRVGDVVRFLRYIPSVQLVGVTGGLAMNNAGEADDIDLFFIVTANTIWVSRFLITIIMDFLGVRRKPDQKIVKNKMCLNMYMAADALTLSEKERDLFSAHEVLQMQPVFDRGVHARFLKANAWVEQFLPNVWDKKCSDSGVQMKNKHIGRHLSVFAKCLTLFEPVAKTMQLWYMHNRRTSEVVSDKLLRFHPYDARAFVKKELGKRLARYNIPLDNVFYAR
jgi:hypothetical protein